MTFRRHLWAALAALFAFGILTVASGTVGRPALIALAILAAACTALYYHYRRRYRRTPPEPVTPLRDDRVIPQDVKVAVAVRDKGRCQLRFPGICLGDREIQYDHVIPWSRGGSSKDPDNIQLACSACNKHKSNKVLA